ncbi:threonine aldolase family protein [Sphingomonas sp. C3-2]|uniref:threonine aldolase family protein n=1 Tax=Sphingomonas sp. C3-2 TaxID=3062169 RepID=UPI00294B1B51|nr:beta-eliminating lyase-related protein [Sphingomonas sp. C3-2]WOK37836.1 beta-eliminating lyase-related protein [Sphingomonas sp. C3-2]
MRFFSDNAAAVCPPVLDAMLAANTLDTAYNGDRWSAALDARFSELFETPVSVLWVSTGTAANALALAALCPPHGGVICHDQAHIQVDECGAPEFFTHGAKLMLAGGAAARLEPDTVRGLLAGIRNDVHQVQPHALSITNATEYGAVYSPDQVAALGAIARDHGLGFHMDGARFANAVAHLGCSPADVTWRAGVDALSFGFTKNGGMNAEALVFFRPDLAVASRYRRKRAGHLLSKGRYLAAQLLAMLDDDVWLANARTANAGAQLLARAAGDRLVYPVEANEVFLRLRADEAAKLRALGFDFYDWGVGEARLVTSWDQDAAAIAPLADAIAAL